MKCTVQQFLGVHLIPLGTGARKPSKSARTLTNVLHVHHGFVATNHVLSANPGSLMEPHSEMVFHYTITKIFWTLRPHCWVELLAWWSSTSVVESLCLSRCTCLTHHLCQPQAMLTGSKLCSEDAVDVQWTTVIAEHVAK